MHIIWHGQSCFQVMVQNPKREKVNIVIDPLRARKADVLLISSAQPYFWSKSGGGQAGPFLIDGPGEYETKGVFFQGISADRGPARNATPARHADASHAGWHSVAGGEVTYYTIEAEEIRLCHLAALEQKELTDDQLEKIGNVDILMIPAGDLSQKIISQIEPRVVIPIYDKGNLDKFLKTMGQKSIEPQDKLVIKKKDLPAEEMEIVVLRP